MWPDMSRYHERFSGDWLGDIINMAVTPSHLLMIECRWVSWCDKDVRDVICWMSVGPRMALLYVQVVGQPESQLHYSKGCRSQYWYHWKSQKASTPDLIFQRDHSERERRKESAEALKDVLCVWFCVFYAPKSQKKNFLGVLFILTTNSFNLLILGPQRLITRKSCSPSCRVFLISVTCGGWKLPRWSAAELRSSLHYWASCRRDVDAALLEPLSGRAQR